MMELRNPFKNEEIALSSEKAKVELSRLEKGLSQK